MAGDAAGELNSELGHLSELAGVIGVEIDLDTVDAAAELDRVDTEFSKRITQYPESVQTMLQQRWQNAFQPVRAKVVMEQERLLKEAVKADAALKLVKEKARDARADGEQVFTTAQATAETVRQSSATMQTAAAEIISITAEERGKLLLSIDESFGLSQNDIFDIFDELDSDGDGKINSTELTKLLDDPKVGLGKDAVQSMMESADRSGDGTLDPTEFMLALSSISTLISDQAKQTAEEMANPIPNTSETEDVEATVEDSTLMKGADEGDRRELGKSPKATTGKKKKNTKSKKKKAKQSRKDGKEPNQETSQTPPHDAETTSAIITPIVELIGRLEEENIASRRNQIIDLNSSTRLRLFADVEISAEKASGQRMPSGFTDGRRLTCTLGGQHRITLLTPAAINKKMDGLNVGETIDIGVAPSGWNLALNRLELVAVKREEKL